MPRKRSLLRTLFAPAIRRGRDFARDDKGVTLVEFGILAVPFFALVGAIFESALVFLAGQVLDSAVEDASRIIKTGEASSGSFDIDDFRDHLCDFTFNLFDCSQIRLSVTTVSDFTSAVTSVDVQDCDSTTCTWTLAQNYSSGSARTVMQVFAYYRWPLMIVAPYFNLKNQPDNFRLLGATRVFRNEPF